MHHRNFFTSVLPFTLVFSAIISFSGLLMLLFSPETIMKNALNAMVAEAPRPIYGALNEVFKDEILDDPGTALNASAVFQPIGLTGSFAAGDRLSVQHGEYDGFRSFVVVDVHRLGTLATEKDDKSANRTWVLVIAEDAAHPDGPKYRFIVEERDPVTFPLEKSNSQAL
ncbi:MAG: hypothetical protein AAFR90_06990 [Pseudomonadota bacterium]